MEDILKCVKCQTDLPSDKPAEKRHVRCIYCGCPNPNPNFSAASALLESDDENLEATRRRERIINLEQSSLSQLISNGILLTGIILFVLSFYILMNKWHFLLISAILLLPTIRSSFVSSRWKNTLIQLSSRSQERYIVNYKVDNTFLVIVSLIYSFYFVYQVIVSVAFRFSDGRVLSLPAVMSVAIASCFIWFMEKFIYVLGELLGQAFPKE